MRAYCPRSVALIVVACTALACLSQVRARGAGDPEPDPMDANCDLSVETDNSVAWREGVQQETGLSDLDWEVVSPSLPCDFRIIAVGLSDVFDGASILPAALLARGEGLILNDISYDSETNSVPIYRRWWMAQPAQSTASFVELDSDSMIGVIPNIVGDYTFGLSVAYADGFTLDCTKTIHVVPPPGCYLELTWVTPDDPSPFDLVGSDLDLHFVHPWAAISNSQPFGYFDPIYDCYEGNLQPDWAPGTKDEKPMLSLSDSDGCGPELLTLALPAKGLCYRVGILYAADSLMGDSYPTLRIYSDGDVLFCNQTTVKLAAGEMWDVGQVCCDDRLFEAFVDSYGQSIILHGPWSDE